ncbi:hypothetical protein HPP92_010391 [Vanilla planifolia]|uniref:GRPD C-terminal domain-containing protein n=1 Tax=Vanilla planifolia TaxID=51239 RepID=A0A835RAD1_VANPL|nr:hypothetical protein HPP92_010391 [Vanilla planifolia]
MSGGNIGLAFISPDSSASCSGSGSPLDAERNSNGKNFPVPSCLIEDASKVHVSVDLVSAARRFLCFLRCLTGSSLLHHPAVILRAIRRYEEIWLPLVANISTDSSSSPMILPPPDVDWVWLCHCLDPESYRKYCAARFGLLIDRPVIIDKENEEYASGRCREIWEIRHPSEPFDLEIDDYDFAETVVSGIDIRSDIFALVARHGDLCSFFADPFVSETVYLVSGRRRDLDGIGNLGKRVVGFGDQASSKEEAERTRRVWEAAFDEPYERAGVAMDPPASFARVCFNWETSDSDVNRNYKGLQPRFFIEGIMIEVRQHGSGCLRSSKLLKRIYFYWNDLLRSTTLTLVQEIEFEARALSSITPPIQAPYLLKCVPDCVTDDSGAMISDVILRMNRYRPQEGRWLSRTVLDHAGKECFIICTRVGRGFWRRGAETPALVKWEDRIIELREGQWSYIASSVGSAPQKIIGTATPNTEDSREGNAVWFLSTGDVLTMQWEHGLSFKLVNENLDHSVMLLQGRKLNYQVKEPNAEEEQQYVTLIRFTTDNPEGKATALLNWKLQAVEFLPEEDAVLVLLLNMAILRTISRIRREDVGDLLSRRRVREVGPGIRDWGSVILPSSSYHQFPHCKPWYWSKADEVLASAEANDWRSLNHRRDRRRRHRRKERDDMKVRKKHLKRSRRHKSPYVSSSSYADTENSLDSRHEESSHSRKRKHGDKLKKEKHRNRSHNPKPKKREAKEVQNLLSTIRCVFNALCGFVPPDWPLSILFTTDFVLFFLMLLPEIMTIFCMARISYKFL